MATDWAKHWRRGYGDVVWKTWVMRLRRAYTHLLHAVTASNPSILELGAGSGQNSLMVAEILQAREITLVDFNEEALAICRETFRGKPFTVNYVKNDILDLELSATFDLVHSEGLIEHFYETERERVFRRHVELCEPNGFIIILVPFESLQYDAFKWVYRRMNRWIYEDEQIFTRDELYALCRRFNLTVLREYTSPLIHEIGIVARRSV
jgi:2-polyprenyl-3-methyl-5-hydroxy-6-metoxy-1,4-benzoquinol methylase